MHCCHVLGGLSISVLLFLSSSLSLAPLDAADDVVEVVVIDMVAVHMLLRSWIRNCCRQDGCCCCCCLVAAAASLSINFVPLAQIILASL